MVVTERLGVVNEVPVNNEEPPVDAANQLITPADAVAPKITVPSPQTDPGVVFRMVGTVAFTVAVTAVLDAVVHVPDVAST